MEECNQAGPNDTINMPYVPLEISLREELDSLPALSSSCCIYRVPDDIRRLDEKAYTPQVISIGPLDHGKEGLEAMEEQKKRYVRDFIHRTKVSLKDYVKKIRDQEARLRSCYAEPIKFSSDEFVKIILVDAAFTIEFLLRFYLKESRHEGDRLLNKPWMFRYVQPDMWMLENQLPFFILEDLYHTCIITDSFRNYYGAHDHERLSIINISKNFFTAGILNLEGKGDKWNRISSSSSSINVQHFVDLIRIFYLPLESELRDAGELKTLNIPSIKEMHQAGVKIKVGSSKNLVDIRFANGTLIIPKIMITGDKLRTLGNVIAFEQCHCMEDNYLNDYVSIMGRFANTPKDVELLVEFGIFETAGTTSVVSSMITKLASEALFFVDRFCYATLCEELNNFCRSSWNKWKANLRQNYFNTPWASISVIAAVVLLTLTLIQTVCSVISAT